MHLTLNIYYKLRYMSGHLSVSAEVPILVREQQIQLAFLDGLRGLAALEVVLFHLFQGFAVWIQLQGDQGHYEVSGWIHSLILFNFFAVGYGQEAVVIFIVLSGYCLMLPVARSPGFPLRGGIRGFISRRVQRILPAYYAALLLSTALVSGLHLLPALSWPSFISHLLLVHNWTPWIFEINPALWSIGVEWQIYFVFALLLLPVCRRFGLGVSVGLALALLPAVLYLTPYSATLTAHKTSLTTGAPWLLGCFGIGMAAASVRLRPDGPGWLTYSMLLGALFGILHFHNWVPVLRFLAVLPHWVGDYLVAGAAACLLLHYARILTFGLPHPWLLRCLESRLAIGLGAFSYSLYLTHLFVFELIGAWFAHLTLTPLQVILVGLSGSLPLALGFAYGFYRLFERPFMHRPASRLLGASSATKRE